VEVDVAVLPNATATPLGILVIVTLFDHFQPIHLARFPRGLLLARQ
jgi:hypothetical protein